MAKNQTRKVSEIESLRQSNAPAADPATIHRVWRATLSRMTSTTPGQNFVNGHDEMNS